MPSFGALPRVPRSVAQLVTKPSFGVRDQSGVQWHRALVGHIIEKLVAFSSLQMSFAGNDNSGRDNDAYPDDVIEC